MKELSYTVFYDQCGRSWSETFQLTARDANAGLRKALSLSLTGLPQYTTVTRIEQALTNQYLGEVR